MKPADDPSLPTIATTTVTHWSSGQGDSNNNHRHRPYCRRHGHWHSHPVVFRRGRKDDYQLRRYQHHYFFSRHHHQQHYRCRHHLVPCRGTAIKPSIVIDNSSSTWSSGNRPSSLKNNMNNSYIIIIITVNVSGTQRQWQNKHDVLITTPTIRYFTTPASRCPSESTV